jgi:hypothetical protein
LVVFVMATTSALQDERATDFCMLDLHNTGPPPDMIIIPAVDLRLPNHCPSVPTAFPDHRTQAHTSVYVLMCQRGTESRAGVHASGAWSARERSALLRMRPLSISCAESCVVLSCGKVDYDKAG